MSGEMEAAGAMATAGLVGAAIEGRPAGAPGEGECSNCGAQLSGPFCSQCGQHAYPRRKLIHVIGELAHGIFYLETKTWRTLPMVLFRPGTLTRNYVYGKRARYLSPLTMFLFSIFVMFFAFTTIDPPQNTRSNEVQVTQEQLDQARSEVDEARAQLERVRANPDPNQPAGLEVRLAEGALQIAESQVARLERQLEAARTRQEEAAREAVPTREADAGAAQSTPPSTVEVGAQVTAPAPPGVVVQRTTDGDGDVVVETDFETWQDGMREVARSEDFVVFGEASGELNERVRRKFENPDLALYQVQDAASKFSFLLAPLSLPFIALLFIWKRGVTLYDHMAYALYALAFAALLFSAAVLFGKLPFVSWAAGWLLLALPVHMWFHLKGAYALGWWSATWRTFFMLNFAFIVACIFLIVVLVLGLMG